MLPPCRKNHYLVQCIVEEPVAAYFSTKQTCRRTLMNADKSFCSPAVPKIAVVAAPQNYVTTSGEPIEKDAIDILVKVLSMRRLHRTSPASGLFNLAAAVLLPGTIPHQLAGISPGVLEQTIRIGHPDGIAEVRVCLDNAGTAISSLGMDRTARRIIKGKLYVSAL